MSCLCCGKVYIKLKYPYLINYADPNEQNLDYLYKYGDAVKLKQKSTLDLMYQRNKCPYSYFSEPLEFYLTGLFPCGYPQKSPEKNLVRLLAINIKFS